MAPKAKAPGAKAAEKAKQAQKAKVAEDKTFGLKNKSKSAKVAKFVQTVQKNATQLNTKEQRAQEREQQAKKDKKAAEEQRKKELEELFAVAIKQPKVPLGVDPKSIVCEFYRHGQCTKGFKCKFSHDLNVERKTAKIDLYSDRRGGEEGEGGMEDWDQETLEKVVNEKHANEKPSNTTNIVCKFFLDAVEKKQYGWFWKCPNGSDCKYRHALPPGYVLKSQMKELLEEEAKNAKDVTEQIEEERSKVQARTPVTQETFKAWHAMKADAKRKAREEVEQERRKKGILNGREIFMQDNFVAVDDAGARDEYLREDDEERRIQEMFEQARKQQEAARAAGAGPSQDEAGAAAAGTGGPADGQVSSSSSGGVGPSSSTAAAANGASSSSGLRTTLQLNEEHAALFDDDSDDNEEMLDDDDDDLDEEELAALEAKLSGAAVGK